MTEDPARVGPDDPHPGSAPDPGLQAATPTVPGAPTAGGPTVRHSAAVGRTRASGLWVGMVLSAVVLLVLLVFILQNGEPVRVSFLGASGTLPTGVALLLAAIAGALVVAVPGTGRILQLRRVARRGAGRIGGGRR